MLLFALLHYLVLSGVSGVVFLTSHTPPNAVNLEALVNALVAVENILVAPRKLILWLWPWEHTPSHLGLMLTCGNSIAWGLVMAVIKVCWQKLTR